MTRVWSILTLAGLLISSAPAWPETLTPKDLDVSCAVAANLEMSRTPKGTEAWNNAATLAVFYLGRLSGRDEQTHWATEIKGLVDERHDQPYPDTLVKQCVDLFRQKLG